MTDRSARERLLIEHIEQVDSTNSELLRREPLLPAQHSAEAIWLVARRQTAGRGRRQRSWRSSAAGSLTASFGTEVSLGESAHLAGLSLVAGVTVAQALAAYGAQVLLKWPNDLHVAGGKAGGILCEARARGAVTRVVIGCGLNLLSPDLGGIDQPAAGLFDAANLPARREFAAGLGYRMLAAVDVWRSHGLSPFLEQWRDRDMLMGRAVIIHHYDRQVPAVARGIDADGSLLAELEDDHPHLVKVVSGEVSVRLA